MHHSRWSITRAETENNLPQAAGHKSFDAAQDSNFSNVGVFSRGELIHIKLLEISSNKDVKAQEDRKQLSLFCDNYLLVI